MISGILNLQSCVNLQQGLFSKNLGLGGNNSLPSDVHTVSTTYYLGEGSLWVKLVSAGVTGRGGRGVTPGNTIQVSR